MDCILILFYNAFILSKLLAHYLTANDSRGIRCVMRMSPATRGCPGGPASIGFQSIVLLFREILKRPQFAWRVAYFACVAGSSANGGLAGSGALV